MKPQASAYPGEKCRDENLSTRMQARTRLLRRVEQTVGYDLISIKENFSFSTEQMPCGYEKWQP